MQYSQEHLKTMVYAEFGGQTECIMGNWKIENWEFSIAFLFINIHVLQTMETIFFTCTMYHLLFQVTSTTLERSSDGEQSTVLGGTQSILI